MVEEVPEAVLTNQDLGQCDEEGKDEDRATSVEREEDDAKIAEVSKLGFFLCKIDCLTDLFIYFHTTARCEQNSTAASTIAFWWR